MSERLEFATQEEAQAAADRIHASMIATDRAYARSVAAGHTTAWAIPYQLAGTRMWCVNIKSRGRIAAEPTDIARLKPIVEGEEVEAPIRVAPTEAIKR